MKNSLDAEPPSKLVRAKEVNVNKGNSNQLILLLKDEKHKSKPVNSGKNLEKNITLNSQDYIFDSDYIKTNNGFVETISTTVKSLSFTNTLDINLNHIISDNNYWKNKSNTEFTDKKLTNFYTTNSSYYFAPQIREKEKKEDLSSQFREQEIKEATYVLHNFDEEPEKED